MKLTDRMTHLAARVVLCTSGVLLPASAHALTPALAPPAEETAADRDLPITPAVLRHETGPQIQLAGLRLFGGCHGCTGCTGCHGFTGCHGCTGCHVPPACHGCHAPIGCHGCHAPVGCHGCHVPVGCHAPGVAGAVAPTPSAPAFYGTHFGSGYYRTGEAGSYRFPYYSYRRPWYNPGPPTYARDTSLPW